jgi:cation transport regulator ChaC
MSAAAADTVLPHPRPSDPGLLKGDLWIFGYGSRTAELIANGHGDRGPNVEYLVRTLKHLAKLGVLDHHLLRVMAAVRALGKA